MRRHRLARPQWANFRGSDIAHCEHEVERRSVRRSEFIPTFAPYLLGRKMVLAQQFKGHRVDLTRRRTARAVAAKLAAAYRPLVDRRFGDDRPGGIAPAEK